MHRLLLGTAAGLCLAVLTGSARADLADSKEEHACGSFGTAVQFAESPAAAAKEARKQEKLVFILHVSGNFEDPKFT
jgi:hypothetical protein